MAHRLHGLGALVAVALTAAGAAHGGGAGSVDGTWLGTPTFPSKHGSSYVYDPIKLVAGPVWVQVESTGVTAASHDAANAKSTCTTRYRFNAVLSAEGWPLYVQDGKPKVSGSNGPPSYGICGSTPGAYRDAVRLHAAGTKLRVEFGALDPAQKATRPGDFDPAFFKSGYLHR